MSVYLGNRANMLTEHSVCVLYLVTQVNTLREHSVCVSLESSEYAYRVECNASFRRHSKRRRREGSTSWEQHSGTVAGSHQDCFHRTVPRACGSVRQARGHGRVLGVPQAKAPRFVRTRSTTHIWLPSRQHNLTLLRLPRPRSTVADLNEVA